LRRIVAGWRGRRETVALVPTMGALHEGHLSLVRLARRRADRVVVSIFVNPAQFAPTEDFSTYPRTFDTDVKLLAQEKADLIWGPANVAVMYPEGFATRIVPEGPATAGLEDKFRPDFFKGVATVVAKLFTQVTPDIAVFGEKDYQQLLIIRRATLDLCMPIEIVGVPTTREPDGLAMSSRNRYLSAEQRAAAPAIHAQLERARAAIESGATDLAAIAQSGSEALQQAGFRPDYFEIRDAATLEEPSGRSRDLVVLTAARLGRARLIDNVRARRPKESG